MRRIDDPAFPELLFARGQRFIIVVASGLAVGLVLSSTFLAAKVFFALLATLVAGFPARRKIFEETWSLAAYLSHTLRFWTAMLGVWLLLALAPALIRAAGSAAVPIAVVLVGVVLLWSHFSAPVMAVIMGALPLSSPQLEPGFSDVLSKARCGRPRLLRAGHPGGHWVNAFALPSFRQPTVLFSNDLLAALDPAETVAIFAHEVAHLEYFNRTRLLRRALVVVALTALLLTLVLWTGPTSNTFVLASWIWPVAVLIVVAALASGNQAREHESDVRAVELTGRAEPLITALTKIHNLMRLPRRWHSEGESRQSHPSLAKRLRAIREAAGIAKAEAAAEPQEDLVLRDADDPEEVVVLATERLHWLRGGALAGVLDPAELLQVAADQRSIHYEDLTDLRLEVSRKGDRFLKIVDSRGQVLKLALRAEDVALVKERLERFDLQVRGTSPEAAVQLARDAAGERRARLWGLAALILGIVPHLSFPFLLAGGLLLLRPSRVTLALGGGVGLAAGLLALRGTQPVALAQSASSVLVLLWLLIGSALLYESVARYRRGAREPADAAKVTLLALAALACIYLLGGLSGFTAPLPLMQTHLWARDGVGLILTLVGLTAALLASGRRARVPATVVALLSALIVIAGTRWFRVRFTADPLAVATPVLEKEKASLERLRERELVGSVVELRLSPSGAKLAALTASLNDTGWRGADYVFQVEMPDGNLRTFPEALDLAFLSDSMIVLLAEGEGGGVRLRTMRLDPALTVEHEVGLPAVVDPSLRVDPLEQKWAVNDTDVEEMIAISLAGEFGSVEFTMVEASLDAPDYSYLDELAVNSAGRGLAVSSRYLTGGLGSLGLAVSPFAGYPTATEIKILDEGGASTTLGTTALEVFCADPWPGQSELLCGANDRGATTGVWRLTEDAESLAPVATVPGYYYGGELVSRDEILLYNYYGPALLVDLSDLRAWEIDVDPSSVHADAGYGSEGGLDSWLSFLVGDSYQIASYQTIAVQGDVLAVAFYADDGYSVVVYRRAR